MAKLSYKAKSSLPRSDFAVKGTGKYGGKGSYPIPDKAHARNALARVSQHGTPSQKAQVRSAVHRKFPTIHMSENGFHSHYKNA